MHIESSTVHLDEALAALTSPPRIFSRSEILGRPCCPIPPIPGIYAWYFRRLPYEIDTKNCITSDLGKLLYVGISPHRTGGTQNLRKRITYHFRGNAYGSTLRLTLGVLLSDQSGFLLRRVGSGKRLTLTHAGEQWLDNWMAENAFVAWYAYPQPWLLEGAILKRLKAPLNISQNLHEPFCFTLTALRKKAKAIAREMAIADEGSQNRTLK
jgi:hypothetical protein